MCVEGWDNGQEKRCLGEDESGGKRDLFAAGSGDARYIDMRMESEMYIDMQT